MGLWTGVWHLHRRPDVTSEERHRAGASLGVSGLRSGQRGEGSAGCEPSWAQCVLVSQRPGRACGMGECGHASWETGKQRLSWPCLGLAPASSLSTQTANCWFRGAPPVAPGDFPVAPTSPGGGGLQRARPPPSPPSRTLHAYHFSSRVLPKAR